jgi:hypothetical protein
MIVCQGIGLSGYIPLEGLVHLYHFFLNDGSVECNYRFVYIASINSHVNSGVVYDFDVLHKVVSFAIVSRFSEFDKFLIIHDVGLLSGYYRAGVVFPRKLLYVILSAMGIYYYRGWNNISAHPDYDFDEACCTSALDDYACIDIVDLQGSEPCLLIGVLGSFETMLFNLGYEKLRKELML